MTPFNWKCPNCGGLKIECENSITGTPIDEAIAVTDSFFCHDCGENFEVCSYYTFTGEMFVNNDEF